MFEPVTFGKYTLVDRLAIGGMAEIFLARIGKQADRIVVVKCMLPQYSDDPQFVDMFIDEAKITTNLDNKNIVPVFDLGRVNNKCYIVMEYVAGQDLQAIYQYCEEQKGVLDVAHVAFIVRELARGLSYAHTRVTPGGEPLNIIHRDVSPQNILISYDGDVKITDFGIASAESKLNKTQAGILKGKFAYMSPEQVVGIPLDHRSDVFAAGIILYELLAMRRLFSGEVEFEILDKVRKAEIAPLSQYNSKVPLPLQKIVYKALARDRDQRYGSAHELEVDLTSFLESYHDNYSSEMLSGLMKQIFGKEHDQNRKRIENALQAMAPEARAELGAQMESTLVGKVPEEKAPDAASDSQWAVRKIASSNPEIESMISERLGTDPNFVMAPTERMLEKAPPKSGGEPRTLLDRIRENPTSLLITLVIVLGLTVVGLFVSRFLEGRQALVKEVATPAQPANKKVNNTENLPQEVPPKGPKELVAAKEGQGEPAEVSEEPSAEPTEEPSEVQLKKSDSFTGFTLALNSEPSGAFVYLDGEELGKTPIKLTDLEPKRGYVISLSKDGYQTQTRTWFASKPRGELNFSLRKRQAVSGNPEGP